MVDPTEPHSDGPADTGTATDARPASGTGTTMTRSEEELVVGSRVREVGRVRLRKRIVTEDVTVTVRKEVVELEQEPITDGDVIDTVVWPEAPEVACEMVRFEEEVVIEKRIVPKERVRLVKTVVVEHKTVTGDVRKEQIQLEGDAAPRRY